MAEQAGGAGRAAQSPHSIDLVLLGAGGLRLFEPREIKIQKASIEPCGPQEARLDAQATVQDSGPGQGLAPKCQCLPVELMVSFRNP